MDVFELVAALTTLAAAFAWLNVRLIRLPQTIGLMVLGLAFSLVLVGLGKLGVSAVEPVLQSVAAIDFAETLLGGMLGALLFAGALHVDLGDLAEQRGVIAISATMGVVLSTLLVAWAMSAVFGVLGISVPFAYCLVFGALISPTDPIAVLGILKGAGVPGSLETKIAGESLFNDGVGIVAFLLLAELAVGDHGVDAGIVLELLVREAVGGVLFGIGLGYLANWLLRQIDDYSAEILITLAVVTGGYALAAYLHTSGPLAMVVSGLFIGNRGRVLAMSESTRRHLDTFWELADEFLNAVLFVLIGLEVVLVHFDARVLAAGVLAIGIVLGARAIGVGSAVNLLRLRRRFSPHAVKMMTWGGIRGGISVALALSLPAGPERDVLLAVTYTVVCFSIIVQGLTVGPLVRRLYALDPEVEAGR